jgi:hypothetical protein
MTHSQQFLSEVEAFLSRSGMSPTAFGKAALNDPNFISDLRAGRLPGLGIVDRVHEFIRQRDADAA